MDQFTMAGLQRSVLEVRYGKCPGTRDVFMSFGDLVTRRKFDMSPNTRPISGKIRAKGGDDENLNTSLLHRYHICRVPKLGGYEGTCTGVFFFR